MASYLMTSGPNLLDARKCKQSGCFAGITLSRDKYLCMLWGFVFLWKYYDDQNRECSTPMFSKHQANVHLKFCNMCSLSFQ